MTFKSSLCPTLKIVKELCYDVRNFELTDLTNHPESIEYEACSFKLNGKKIEYRSSKISPTKTGQFVTIWKRNNEGVTAPFDMSDNFDFIIITSKTENNMGQFIFPKSVLAEKGIISQNNIRRGGGKRGIRVYPPWDKVNNKQAEKTQSWQIKYFVEIKANETPNFDILKTGKHM